MEEEREIERLERDGERVEDRIEEARADWERKKADDGVPGAVGDVAEMDAEDAPETDYPAKG